MRMIEDNDLKRLQLDILKNVNMFCRERNINYSLAYGTLLGAVRHQGYIPWDDDIDICMPRSSYNRFVLEYEDPTGIYECLSFEKDENFLYPFAKISDRRTVVLEQARFVNRYEKLGVNIDVFPVDGANINDYSQFKKQRRLRLMKYYKLRELSRERSLIKNCALMMVRATLSPFSISSIVSNMMSNAQKYEYDVSEHVEVILGYDHEKPLPKEIYEELSYLRFEDSQFPVPSNYDVLLTHIYGDYMTLPPVEQRKPGHKAIRYYKD